MHQPPLRVARRVPWPWGVQSNEARLIEHVRGSTKLPQLYSPRVNPVTTSPVAACPRLPEFATTIPVGTVMVTGLLHRLAHGPVPPPVVPAVPVVPPRPFVPAVPVVPPRPFVPAAPVVPPRPFVPAMPVVPPRPIVPAVPVVPPRPIVPA